MGETAIWAGLAVAAACAVLAGLWMAGLRRRSRARATGQAKVRGVDPAVGALLAGLIGEGVALDLVPVAPDGGKGDAAEPLARCVPVEAGPGGLVCELLDCAAPDAVHAGLKVQGFFAPLPLAGRKVNALDSEILAMQGADDPPRIVLALPQGLRAVPRRRHPRKKVSDPRFIRLRLWLADVAQSTVYFPEASPDLWINAYDGRHGDENAVSDISPGGLALEVRAALAPAGLAPGARVVLKCSLFQFKDKQFKPYWYAGKVRAVTQPAQGLRRIAVAFSHVGAPDRLAPQGLVWTALESARNPETIGASA